MTQPGKTALFAAILMVLIAACSSPLTDNNEDPTPTSPPATVPSTPTAVPGSTATSTTVTVTPAGSASPTGAAATPTDTTAPETRTAGTSTPTATTEPLPESGAELLIDGQAVTRIVQGSDTGRTMFAVAGDKLWRTNDGGRSWAAAGEGNIGPLVVALNDEDTIYSGDRGGCGRGFSFFEFRRSTDAGRTWEVVEDSLDIQPLLAYESSDSSLVYGTNCGLSVSTDGGSTWSLVPDLNGEDLFAIATERSDPMAQIIVVSATEGGTGRLFLMDTSNPAQPLFVDALAQFWGDAAIDWTEGRMVLANAHRVGVSDDGGETWSWSRSGLEDVTYSADPLFEPIPEAELDPYRRLTEVVIDPTNRDRIWLGGSHGAFLSVDGGQTWTRVGADAEVTGIAIAALTDRVLISTESGTRLWSLDGD
ncbi:MAG: hypothetical protein R3A46_12965 [Thermomicrobiales bacterium]